ncbi:hypothetical protein QAD02_005832 [Eretmocerus hayati]|uniref:Uncharacterized protein n=1 Tax=Eretmocerus hayati TaxID=131215 RepID=A0ACC2NTM6_9HYME|nr:hypothetical protein QAD02_005832 [Eretmocerus hayati]
MESGERKLKTLSVADGVKVIQADQDDITARLESGDRSRRRKSELEYPDVDEVTFKWLKQCRDNNVNLSGSLVRDEASFCAQSLGHPDFQLTELKDDTRMKLGEYGRRRQLGLAVAGLRGKRLNERKKWRKEGKKKIQRWWWAKGPQRDCSV